MTPDSGLMVPSFDERYQTEESVRLLQQDASHYSTVSMESFRHRIVPTASNVMCRGQLGVPAWSPRRVMPQFAATDALIDTSNHSDRWPTLPTSIKPPRMEEEHTWLDEAVTELGRIDHYIQSDGLPDVGLRARSETRRLLEDLRRQPIAPVVYPSEGDLVIHFKAPSTPASVVIEVSDDGRAVCYAHMHGKSRRASYDASTDLPDAFLWEQMHKLANLV